jgi:guanylate kinase
MPKDKETLLERRGNRGEGRKAIALSEVPKAKELDFLIVNDDLEEAVTDIMGIIECMRKSSMRNPKSQTFLEEFY